MKQYFKDKYLTIKDWLKQEKWFILLLALMTVSLFVSMFTEYALIACIVITIVCSILFNFEHNLGFFLFSQAFEAVLTTSFSGEKIRVYAIIYSIVFLVACLRHLIKVIQKKEKLNLKILVVIAIVTLYIMLTMNKFNLVQVLKHLVAFSFIYLIFVENNKFKFNNILIWTCVGIILSIIFEQVAYSSDRMVNTMGIYFIEGVRKSQAMFPNPNVFAMYAILIVACILYKTIFEDIMWIIPFAVIFPHSYTTLSRNYILSFILAFILICIFVCIKHNKKSFFGFLTSLVLIIAVCFSQLNVTKAYVNRIVSAYNEFCSLVGIDKRVDKVFTDIESNKESYENVKPKPKPNPEPEQPSKPDMEPEQAPLPGENLEQGPPSSGQENIIPEDALKDPTKWIDGTPIDPGRSGLWKRYLKDYTSSTKVILLGRGSDADVLGMMPHNSYIEMAWRYGIVGVTLISSIFYFIAKELFKGKSYLSLILLGQILLLNLFESCIFNFMAIFMILLMVGSSRERISKVEDNKEDLF